MQIIQVPSVFSCKLPDGEWLNLALIRQLELKSDPLRITITWANGDVQEFKGSKAIAILQAWEEAEGIDKSGEELGFIEGQLLAAGADEDLIEAIKHGYSVTIAQQLLLVKDLDRRARLVRIIKRLGLIVL